MSRFTLLLLLSLFLFASASPVSQLKKRHASRYAGATAAHNFPIRVVEPSAAAATWSIDAGTAGVNVSADLYGIFFEEINHAGQGGLYAQQIQNSNFEDTRWTTAPWAEWASSGVTYQLSLDETKPINGANGISLLVRAAGSAGSTAGIVNPGFWGINVTAGEYGFTGSMYVRSNNIKQVTVALVSSMQDRTVYATTAVSGVTADWSKLSFNVGSTQFADPKASFLISWNVTSDSDYIAFDVVTLFPQTSWNGIDWIRSDLAQKVADIHPAFMRFPGGCYVEGNIIPNRFNWKKALGPIENRGGHWDLWGYWSEDGLGLFEYLSFIEKLTDSYGQPTRAIWVVNNGVSHDQSIAPELLMPYVQDALDSIEFAQGSTDTYYGALRAEMGHATPFHIDYLAIGNEDCGKPDYLENYKMFYDAINAKYPAIKLISNCAPQDLKGLPAPQVWDYHIYTSSADLIRMSHYFDDPKMRETGSKVFNSEYAVTSDAGAGNVIAALAEAAWMIGLERNSDLVTTASYAPLFVNTNDRFWMPDAIVFDSHESYGTPSYWNQVLFSNSLMGIETGTAYTLMNKLDGASTMEAGVVVGRLTSAAAEAAAASYVLVHKFVNYGNSSQELTITISNLPAGATLNPTLDVTVMTGTAPHQENSFQTPRAVAPMSAQLKVSGPSFTITVPALTVAAVRAYASF